MPEATDSDYPPIRAGDAAALLFALDVHLAAAAKSASDTLEAIGAARARLAELRRLLPWAITPSDTE